MYEIMREIHHCRCRQKFGGSQIVGKEANVNGQTRIGQHIGGGETFMNIPRNWGRTN